MDPSRSQELRIGNKFRLGRKLGEGSFGDVFIGYNIITDDEVAIKLEHKSSKHPQLHIEAKFLHRLQNQIGFTKLKWSGELKEGDYNCLVMELLGPSLENLLEFSKRKMSLKTVLMIGDQIIQRIESLHLKNYIHRDIKPENFLMGNKNKGNLVYIIDFGLIKKYIDKSGKHLGYRDDRPLTGTARYASLNTHLGIEQSRRDDMESIGYMFIYLLKGSLPWQGMQATNRKSKYDVIAQKKASIPIPELCKDLPKEFEIYMDYVRTLFFDQKPDYDYLRSLFRGLFNRNGFVYDYKFDWSQSSIKKTQQNSQQQVSSVLQPKNITETNFTGTTMYQDIRAQRQQEILYGRAEREFKNQLKDSHNERLQFDKERDEQRENNRVIYKTQNQYLEYSRVLKEEEENRKNELLLQKELERKERQQNYAYADEIQNVMGTYMATENTNKNQRKTFAEFNRETINDLDLKQAYRAGKYKYENNRDNQDFNINNIRDAYINQNHENVRETRDDYIEQGRAYYEHGPTG